MGKTSELKEMKTIEDRFRDWMSQVSRQDIYKVIGVICLLVTSIVGYPLYHYLTSHDSTQSRFIITTDGIVIKEGDLAELTTVSSDIFGLHPINSIDWGALNQSETYYRIIYVRNMNLVPIWINFYTQNATPDYAFDHMDLSFSYIDDKPINYMGVRKVLLTKYVHDDALPFNFTYKTIMTIS